MNCPACRETQLVMAERSGVEIDYCPRCRGVWLDRGELDKLIERAGTAAFGPVQPASPQQQYRREEYRRDDDDDDRYPHAPNGQQPYRKKRSWLGDILDFD